MFIFSLEVVFKPWKYCPCFASLLVYYFALVSDLAGLLCLSQKQKYICEMMIEIPQTNCDESPNFSRSLKSILLLSTR